MVSSPPLNQELSNKEWGGDSEMQGAELPTKSGLREKVLETLRSVLQRGMDHYLNSLAGLAHQFNQTVQDLQQLAQLDEICSQWLDHWDTEPRQLALF